MPISGFERKDKSRIIPDGKECLLLWIELGTLNKVATALFERGIKTRKGTPVANRQVAHHVYNWVLAHVDESWEIYQNAGSEFSRVQFDRWLIRIAVSLHYWRKARFMEWIKIHGYEQHSDIWQKRFPPLDEFGVGDIQSISRELFDMSEKSLSNPRNNSEVESSENLEHSEE